jgi:hypothetical protein
VLDRSSSVGSHFEGETVTFTLDLIAGFPNAARISIITFDEFVDVILPITGDPAAIEAGKAKLVNTKAGYGTCIRCGLQEILNEMINNPTVYEQWVFLVSDGIETRYGNGIRPAPEIAADIKEIGARIVILAVGNEVDVPMLQDVSSKPVNVNYIAVSDYPHLPNYQTPIVQLFCPSFEPICTVFDEDRLQCGEESITQVDCLAEGCCYDNFTASNVPKCYIGATPSVSPSAAPSSNYDRCSECDCSWANSNSCSGNDGTLCYSCCCAVTYDYYRKVPGVGGWGGTCNCPSGKTYPVGDYENNCASIACIGGYPSKCERVFKQERAGMAVTCSQVDNESDSFVDENGAFEIM